MKIREWLSSMCWVSVMQLERYESRITKKRKIVDDRNEQRNDY